MSIWASWQQIGWEPECPPAPGHFDGGEVRAYAQGWSNHYPDAEVERPASVDVASVPVWCVPGHSDEYTPDEDWGPWLRLGITAHDALTWSLPRAAGKPTEAPMYAHVVMDELAVRTLRDQLTKWLDGDFVYPAGEDQETP